jgi:glyoxylase-like metal-dependent hydrolase (beta-lactamase superfamily II)
MHMAIPFDLSFSAPYDEALTVAPRVRRLLARNPTPFTFRGTGVYIVGERQVAVLDPGPDDPHHLAVLRRALGNEAVTHILITHTHRDHSPAARALKEWTGATVYGFGPHGSGKAEEGLVAEEGGDAEFVPDIVVRDGDVIEGLDFAFECVHTPGHTSNHVCYALERERALFCGDHVMGWSTTVIVPPDGDMADYLDSLKKVLGRADSTYWPTHGGPIRDPKPFVNACLAHRYDREAQILAGLRDGVSTIPKLVERLYVGLDANLRPAAALSVLAHLIKLVNEGRALASSTPSLSAIYQPL